MVFSVGLACSNASALSATNIVLSNSISYYSKLPVTCCKKILLSLSSNSVPPGATANCCRAPYVRTVCWYGWSCARRGVPCLEHMKAWSTYPGIDPWTRFSRNTIQSWVRHIFCLPNLLKFCSDLWVHLWGVLHVPFLHTFLKNHPPPVWSKLVSLCASITPVLFWTVHSHDFSISLPTVSVLTTLFEAICTSLFVPLCTQNHPLLSFPSTYIPLWRRLGNFAKDICIGPKVHSNKKNYVKCHEFWSLCWDDTV